MRGKVDVDGDGNVQAVRLVDIDGKRRVENGILAERANSCLF